MIMKFKSQKGALTILVLVFSAVFFVLFSGLVNYVALQHKHSVERASYAESLEIAEAGLNYYRWHLAHDPDDLQDGTGVPGPYIHTYDDPEGGTLGSFSLDISSQTQCNEITGISITSTGSTLDFPNVERTVSARYVSPTVADFSFLIDDNVWAGADREIKGPYHANGGIRMDGENNSLVTSAQTTWTCTPSFGCDPARDEDGVFGAGENSNLWRFPVPSFDFDGITVDLASMKALSTGGTGLYFGPTSVSDDGYHIILKSDRSIDVYIVNSVSGVSAYDSTQGWHTEYSIIASETFLGNYLIAATCGLVFFEDTLWVGDETMESKINGKITIVAADLISSTVEADIWLQGNITYTNTDGSDGLVLIGQRNSLIGLNTPDSMELNGIFIAQTGRFGRNHYGSSQNPYHKRQLLELIGSVVSNGRVGTKWTYSSGAWASGYNKRETTYDPSQTENPPPFLPMTSEEHDFRGWEEIE
jgi:hypothetical protein